MILQEWGIVREDRGQECTPKLWNNTLSRMPYCSFGESVLSLCILPTTSTTNMQAHMHVPCLLSPVLNKS